MGLKWVPFYLGENKEQAIFSVGKLLRDMVELVSWRAQNWQASQQLVSNENKSQSRMSKESRERLLAYKWGGVICLVIWKCICHLSAVSIQFSSINASPRVKFTLQERAKNVFIAPAIKVSRSNTERPSSKKIVVFSFCMIHTLSFSRWSYRLYCKWSSPQSHGENKAGVSTSML